MRPAELIVDQSVAHWCNDSQVARSQALCPTRLSAYRKERKGPLHQRLQLLSRSARYHLRSYLSFVIANLGGKGQDRCPALCMSNSFASTISPSSPPYLGFASSPAFFSPNKPQSFSRSRFYRGHKLWVLHQLLMAPRCQTAQRKLVNGGRLVVVSRPASKRPLLKSATSLRRKSRQIKARRGAIQSAKRVKRQLTMSHCQTTFSMKHSSPLLPKTLKNGRAGLSWNPSRYVTFTNV